jgi:hypothetical protein
MFCVACIVRQVNGLGTESVLAGVHRVRSPGHNSLHCDFLPIPKISLYEHLERLLMPTLNGVGKPTGTSFIFVHSRCTC